MDPQFLVTYDDELTDAELVDTQEQVDDWIEQCAADEGESFHPERIKVYSVEELPIRVETEVKVSTFGWLGQTKKPKAKPKAKAKRK